MVLCPFLDGCASQMATPMVKRKSGRFDFDVCSNDLLATEAGRCICCPHCPPRASRGCWPPAPEKKKNRSGSSGGSGFFWVVVSLLRVAFLAFWAWRHKVWGLKCDFFVFGFSSGPPVGLRDLRLTFFSSCDLTFGFEVRSNLFRPLPFPANIGTSVRLSLQKWQIGLTLAKLNQRVALSRQSPLRAPRFQRGAKGDATGPHGIFPTSVVESTSARQVLCFGAGCVVFGFYTFDRFYLFLLSYFNKLLGFFGHRKGL